MMDYLWHEALKVALCDRRLLIRKITEGSARRLHFSDVLILPKLDESLVPTP
jgi:hypothetical protein